MNGIRAIDPQNVFTNLDLIRKEKKKNEFEFLFASYSDLSHSYLYKPSTMSSLLNSLRQ